MSTLISSWKQGMAPRIAIITVENRVGIMVSGEWERRRQVDHGVEVLIKPAFDEGWPILAMIPSGLVDEIDQWMSQPEEFLPEWRERWAA